jgi:bifunctional NMN adenylyltransferase/nudix hydrolase
MTEPVGVVIGRFQLPRPHPGHIDLIQEVCSRHKHVLVLVGYTQSALPSIHDPIPEGLRTAVLRDLLAEPTMVWPLADCPDDLQWSHKVDERVAAFAEQLKLPVGTAAVLYGGPENALSHYRGAHEVHSQSGGWAWSRSGTEIRLRIGPSTDERFLAGMVYAQRLRPALSYQTIDAAIYNAGTKSLLLGQKAEYGSAGVLIGGFVDATDASLEATVKRECWEEAGQIEIGDPTYLASFRVHDWRYRNSPDKILTALFAVPFIFGAPKGADDLQSVRWVPYAEALAATHPIHQPLVTRFLEETL